MRKLNQFIRINAEGQGDLTQRLDTSLFDNNETRDLAKWINNMIDSLEGVMLQVKLASIDVLTNQRKLSDSTVVTASATERVSGKIGDMILSIRSQLKDIDIAKDAAGEMRETLRQLEDKASAQIGVAQGELVRIGDKMGQIAGSYRRRTGPLKRSWRRRMRFGACWASLKNFGTDPFACTECFH